MFKSAFVGLSVIVCATPALASNGPANYPTNGPASMQSAPIAGGPVTGGPPTISPAPGCYKVRAQLTPEQRAERKAMHQQRVAQRVAQGLPAKAPRDASAPRQHNRGC
jgi:hypothetical protein